MSRNIALALMVLVTIQTLGCSHWQTPSSTESAIVQPVETQEMQLPGTRVGRSKFEKIRFGMTIDQIMTIVGVRGMHEFTCLASENNVYVVVGYVVDPGYEF